MNDNTARAGDTVTLDPENPWLGLFSYSEETRAYFHGRDEEAAELARRVQRKLLTVLFGQSGLGKTSLLRAGLVPRLRTEGFCPVYVRVDYAPESPPPSEQIKQAILRATAEAGHWTRPGSAIEGESLWEFLHHREDLLRDRDGNTLMPLLIFDQFEEIFTLGQADDTGRLRAKQFLEDLADLVENRPPVALEERIENDDNASADFDFARADYRILIALREDYLAHLEGVKTIMPSITQNRMRLARMNGVQALSAVVKPGGKLVSQEVAEAIVRFVAGGSELANAEIEPSLLSLVCRELNTVRLGQKRREISADLLAGSRDTILSEFYERSLADQPAGVRRVVEDDLLTESGYRESLAEERVGKALAAAGAAPDALATLVNRRLLRIEERLDMRRVELTHDVLCAVVLASRNSRREREAREEAERQLAAQREREAAVHRALVRARTIASVCIVLMLLAVAGAIFGWINMRRARSAELDAQNSRSNAEKLVSFLIEDFYTELAPTGRLDTLGKLAQKAVAYYDSLPPQLVTPQTRINRAMALVREGASLSAAGKAEAAFKSFGEAQSEFEKLHAAGNHGEDVVYGLALALYEQGSTVIRGGRGTAVQLQQAADLLKPLVYGDHPSRRVRQLYGDDLNYLSHTQPNAQSVATCEEARKVLTGIGALDLSDLNAASSYADTADSEARVLLLLGKVDAAQQLEQEVYELAEKVLARRPSDLHSLLNRVLAAGLLSEVAERRHDDATAADYARRAVQASEEWVRSDPSNLEAWWYWTVALRGTADEQFDRGEIANAIATMHSLFALEQDKRLPSSLGPRIWYQWLGLANMQAEAGDAAGAAQSMKSFAHDTNEYIAQLAANDPRRALLANADQRVVGANLQLLEGEPKVALASATALVAQVEPVKVPADNITGVNVRTNMLRGNLGTAARAALQLGDYAQAEALALRWSQVPPAPFDSGDPRQLKSSIAAVLANAVALQGRDDEANKILQPALAYYREQQQAGAHGVQFRRDFAYALYVSAIAAPADAAGQKQRKADLDEAGKLIGGASAEAQKLADMRYVSGLIVAARTPQSG
ncbi:MAG: ATP-binding protein [Xanthomonadales bacterium PRO7]|nr:ATP-binding protein [Xanthomonadales bacterium PRO7]